MTTMAKATPAQIQRACELMGELGGSLADIIGVFNHVILETTFFNVDDAEILSWFPAAFLEEAIQWLEVQAREWNAEEVEQAMTDIDDDGNDTP